MLVFCLFWCLQCRLLDKPAKRWHFIIQIHTYLDTVSISASLADLISWGRHTMITVRTAIDLPSQSSNSLKEWGNVATEVIGWSHSTEWPLKQWCATFLHSNGFEGMGLDWKGSVILLQNNSYGESRDSSCEKLWVPVQNQWAPVQKTMSPRAFCNHTVNLKTDSKTPNYSNILLLLWSTTKTKLEKWVV